MKIELGQLYAFGEAGHMRIWIVVRQTCIDKDKYASFVCRQVSAPPGNGFRIGLELLFDAGGLLAMAKRIA